MKRVFLSGDGGEKDSVELDKRFVSLLDPNKTLLYIPVAMVEEKYPACLQWFAAVFSSLGVTNIDMRSDLHQEVNPNEVAGIYMGGGDTVRLLRELRVSGFDVTLRQCIEQGIPVYGGSAGAIVLGKDIRTAPEAKTQETDAAVALDTLQGHAVYCHLTDLVGAQAAQRDLSLPVIALTERAGVYLQDQELEAVGAESVWLLEADALYELKPGEKHLLETVD